MSVITKIFGDPNEKVIKGIRPIIDSINALEKEFEAFSDEKLKSLKDDFKIELEKGKTLDDILPRAFAAVREAGKRTLGQRHYDVQLIGGMVLHRGQIAEMRTGEGKTLVATLAVYLNALDGKGVHVVTVNDYLARRDSVWMGQIYNALGMSIGCINHETSFLYDPNFASEKLTDPGRDATASFRVEYEYLRPISRREAYAADITYGTNNEFGFDYLRDNMAPDLKEKTQRGFHYAIVDEVDSILIDEARTPLIISAPDMQSSDLYRKFSQLVTRLQENDPSTGSGQGDYNVDEKMRAATLTEAGIAKMEKMLGMGNIYTEGGITMVHHIEQALRAQTLFKLDRDYVVKDGEVIIVDEFTGRLMQGRRYSEGLHQAIEAKENVEVQKESRTLATVTFQNYFRMYKKLAGMTGTASTEAEEFSKIYNLEVVTIPTNKAMVRKDMQDRIYKTHNGKLMAIVKEVREMNEKGQPVLIGTISIEKNEELAQLLEREGVEAQVLNAKHHEKEAQIIAQAGRFGAVTVATNMAGRGVDIIFGGNPYNEEEAKKVKDAGGLHVIGTERHESRRIDNQLRGRSGRQGDPGSTQFYISTDDDLMRIFGSDRMRKLMDTLRIPEDMPIENGMISRSIESAQKKVEGHNFDIRKHLVEYDDVVNKHREIIYKKRDEILVNENVKDEVLEYIEGEIEQVVSFHTQSDDEKSWNLKEIYEVASTIFPLKESSRIDLGNIRTTAGDGLEDAQAREKIIGYLFKLAVEAYNEQEAGINKAMNDETAMRKMEKGVILRAIDVLWMEHLDAMDHLRQGIGLRGYGQRDPLIEYKQEAYKMFSELVQLINKQIVYSIYKVGMAYSMAAPRVEHGPLQFSAPAKEMERGSGGILLKAAEKHKGSEPVKSNVTDSGHYQGNKVGRNEPCPCGSGLKFKRCHGR